MFDCHPQGIHFVIENSLSMFISKLQLQCLTILLTRACFGYFLDEIYDFPSDITEAVYDSWTLISPKGKLKYLLDRKELLGLHDG